MADLKRCFEAAGFTNVRTILSSGNVAFDARLVSETAIEQRAESSMQQHLGRTFYTIVRSTSCLRELLQADPYAGHAVSPAARRVVTFLREPVPAKVPLPLEADGARVLGLLAREAFTVYTPHARGAVFMVLIAKAFGVNATTRTWETVTRCAGA